MYQLYIHAQSYGRIFEVLPEEIESTDLLTEEIVSHTLLDLFGEAVVDEVTVRFSSAARMGQRDCSIQIKAQCSLQSFRLLPCTKEGMKLVIRERVCSMLKQLFGPMTIDSITVQPFFMESR